MAEMNVFEENERQVNGAISAICKKLFVLIPLIAIANFMHLFRLDFKTLLITLAAMAAVLSTLIIVHAKLPYYCMKWFVVISFILFTTMMYGFTFGNILLLWAVPLALSALYYSKKLILMTSGMVLVGLCVGEFLASQRNLVFEASVQWIPLHLGIYAMMIFTTIIILLQLAKNTRRMILNSEQLTRKMAEYYEQNIEISKSLNDSAEEVKTNIEDSSRSIEHVGQSVVSMTESSIHISELAHQTEQIVSDTVSHIREAVSQTSLMKSLSEKMTEVSERSRENLLVFFDTTDNIQEMSRNSSKSIDVLVLRMQEVMNQLSKIGKIAQQTEILALNASIEAARSGEAGKGFAVIANQVKELALESKGYSQSIQQMLETVNEETNLVAKNFAENEKEIEHGSSLVEQTGKNFDIVLQVQHEMVEHIQDIDETMKEFFDKTEQIQDAIQDLLQKNDKNVQGIEEINSSIKEMTVETKEIETSIGEIVQKTEILASKK